MKRRKFKKENKILENISKSQNEEELKEFFQSANDYYDKQVINERNKEMPLSLK